MMYVCDLVHCQDTNNSIEGSLWCMWYCILVRTLTTLLNALYDACNIVHVSVHSFSWLDACTTLVVPLMCSFWILSLRIALHVHLSILSSFTSSRASCPLVVAQVYAGLTSFVNRSLQFHWHPPVTRCTHSLCNFCCHASCLLHTWTEILKTMHSS